MCAITGPSGGPSGGEDADWKNDNRLERSE